MSGPRIGSLCTGYGGLDAAVQSVLGGELAWVADNDPGAAAILAHRFPTVPNLGDITAVDWQAAEPVDVLCAGFPCQDISCAGKRAGMRDGTRSGLWSHVARAVAALRPPLVVIENVKELLSERADSYVEQCPWCLGDTDPESAMRALGAVLADLAEIGFDAEWVSLPAASAGACHLRWRVFVVAWPAADTAGHQPGWDAPLARDGTGEARHGPGAGHRLTPADPQGIGTGEPADEADPLPGGRDARAVPGGRGAGTAADPERGGRDGGSPEQERGPVGGVASPWDRPGAFGRYEAAVRRHERAFRRQAPSPVEPGRNGALRLSPRFVEWMQGLPDGWVTDVPGLSRNQMLKALGNGVVPQQAAHALSSLLSRIPGWTARAA